MSTSPAKEPLQTRAWAWARSVPTTMTVVGITAAVFVIQLSWPPLLGLFQRDGEAVLDGQWWRLVTSMLLHGGGWPHILFNLLGVVLVGAAVEPRLGWWRWLVVYVVSGAGAGLLQVLLFPEAADSGASGGLAGLVGAMVLQVLRGRRVPVGAMILATFFTSYLAVLVWFGPIAAAVTGTLLAAIVGTVVRRVDRARLGLAVVVVIAVSTLAMLLAWDVHGQALVIGFAVAWVLQQRPDPAPDAAGRARR